MAETTELQTTALVVAWVFTVPTALLVLLRIIVRTKLKPNWGYDDVAICASLVGLSERWLCTCGTTPVPDPFLGSSQSWLTLSADCEHCSGNNGFSRSRHRHWEAS